MTLIASSTGAPAGIRTRSRSGQIYSSAAFLHPHMRSLVPLTSGPGWVLTRRSPTTQAGSVWFDFPGRDQKGKPNEVAGVQMTSLGRGVPLQNKAHWALKAA